MSVLFKNKINWKYAIGEVILIFLGITLAIAFDNWNEWRRERKVEKSVLENLEKNIDRNVQLLNRSLQLFEDIDHSKKIIIDAMNTRLPYSDTLDYHFNMARRMAVVGLVLNRDGYESLKSDGLNILTNGGLKDEIIHLFEVSYPNLIRYSNWTQMVGDPTKSVTGVVTSGNYLAPVSQWMEGDE